MFKQEILIKTDTVFSVEMLFRLRTKWHTNGVIARNCSATGHAKVPPPTLAWSFLDFSEGQINSEGARGVGVMMGRRRPSAPDHCKITAIVLRGN